MGTSQSAVARLETGTSDVLLSTVDRYATALGWRLEWSLEARPGREGHREPAGLARRSRRDRTATVDPEEWMRRRLLDRRVVILDGPLDDAGPTGSVPPS